MKKIIFLVLAIAIIFLAFVVIQQFILVRKAHSTFENYYQFRGCVQLLKKTDTYGICKISSGQTIKIVKDMGKWYLDGDLPVCYFGKFCL